MIDDVYQKNANFSKIFSMHCIRWSTVIIFSIQCLKLLLCLFLSSPRLGILILSNMVLYHHLMSYRSPIPTHTDNNHQQYRYMYMYTLDSCSNYVPYSCPCSPAFRVVDKSSPPSSHDEWLSLVQEQLKSRDQELHHWQDTLYSFVQALDQVSPH